MIVHPTDVMTLLPVYQCSVCKNLVSGYYPDTKCVHCGSKNKKSNQSVELAICELEGW